MGNPEGIRPFPRSVRGCRNVKIDAKEIGWTMGVGLMWIKMGMSSSPCSKQSEERSSCM